VVDFKPGHPSESFEEVRDQVVEDYKLLKAYEEVEMLAGQLVYEAFEQDLSRPWIENQTLRYFVEELPEGDKIRFIEPAPISRVRNLAFEAARGRPKDGVMVGDLGIRFSNEDVDRLFELEFMEDKAIVIENKEEAAVVVAQWIETIKGTETEFNQMRPQILRNMRANRQREIRSNWLDPEQIRARTGYQPVVQ